MRWEESPMRTATGHVVRRDGEDILTLPAGFGFSEGVELELVRSGDVLTVSPAAETFITPIEDDGATSSTPDAPPTGTDDDPIFRLIRDGKETLVRASELPRGDRKSESNIQRLVRKLRELPAPSTIEVRDTELIPERKGL